MSPPLNELVLMLGMAVAAGLVITRPGVSHAGHSYVYSAEQAQAMVEQQEIAGAVTVVVSKEKTLHLESTGFAVTGSA